MNQNDRDFQKVLQALTVFDKKISIILSLKNGIVPPTINHQSIDENINPKLNLTL